MAVLFDLDGTLLDTAPDFLTAVNKMLQQQGSPTITYQELRPLVSFGRKYIVENIFKISPTDNALYQTTLATFLEYYEATDHDSTVPFPHIEELLTQLEEANITWGIVTNKPGYLTYQVLERTNLAHRAKCIVCGDTTPYAKPHPEPLLYASKLINTDPGNCIYIGDAKHDIIAGNAAGMYTISALYGYIEVHNDAIEWPAKNAVQSVQEIYPLVYQWHKQNALIS
jgi:phosphoglycolate phosphatase